jgi:RNA polymerase sigma-70 factor, ECF subfamily
MQPLAQLPADDPLSQSPEQRLVTAVLRKERKATAEFVDRCSDWVYPFLYRRLMPRTEMLEDLTQEILLTAWQKLPSFRGDGGLQAWVMGIARHKVEDYYRRRIRDTEPLDDDPPEIEEPPSMSLQHQLDVSAQQDRVAKVLAGLPEAYALALLWRYRSEKSVREMAELSGKTEKAVERLLARAREKFRQRWNDGHF